MGLFGKKKTPGEKNRAPVNSLGQRVDRLLPDGRLPSGWIEQNLKLIETQRDENRYFSDAYFAARGRGVLEEYAALQSLILYIEDTKRQWVSKGECYAEWISRVLEDPAPLKERLQYLEDNKDELLRKEQQQKKIRKELIEIIRQEPGIMQSVIYKRFPPELKFAVSNELYIMADDIIRREKSGRSYKLFLKE